MNAMSFDVQKTGWEWNSLATTEAWSQNNVGGEKLKESKRLPQWSERACGYNCTKQKLKVYAPWRLGANVGGNKS